MNKIYWDKDKISILTNQIEAVEHKHYTMQLFLGLEKNLTISVSGEELTCSCILINKLCTGILYDKHGQPHVCIDEYMKRHLEIKLISSIVTKAETV